MEKRVSLVLGSMTFGEQIFGMDVFQVIDAFLKRGYREIDTAYVYNEGRSEKLIGKSLKKCSSSEISVSTKVNPRITGKLDGNAVHDQLEESLLRLGIEKVKTLYLHFPDPQTPIESALEACAELYEAGKFSELGLSNFPAWLVADVYYKCQSHGWMLPKVYQGLYNPLSRKAETELNQALDYFGMRFYAFNPLAGGLLTNKYHDLNESIKKGRFTYRPNYQDRYWKKSFFDAVGHIRKKCEEIDLTIVEAAYRWLIWHSMLDSERGDAVIIGASRLEQFIQNMDAVKKGPLPDEICKVMDEAWEISKVDAPEYFKFYTP